MKFCSVCGNELTDDAVICTVCGCAVEDTPTETTCQDTVIEEKKSMSVGKIIGIVSLGLGALTLVVWLLKLFCGCCCCCIPYLAVIVSIVFGVLLIACGILSVISGIVALILSKKDESKNVFALFGILLGIVPLVIDLLLTILVAVVGFIFAAGYIILMCCAPFLTEILSSVM